MPYFALHTHVEAAVDTASIMAAPSMLREDRSMVDSLSIPHALLTVEEHTKMAEEMSRVGV